MEGEAVYPSMFNPWLWREPGMLGPDFMPVDDEAAELARRGRSMLAGYKVEATDGSIGSVDEATDDNDEHYLIVDTGPWIFGRKVLLPAGTVQRVDHSEQKVYVDRTKEQIKDSPEYDAETFGKPDYRAQVGDYYGGTYRSSDPHP
jgi:hypothetical protein